ncbi:hypothetical protein HV782_003745 [Pseudomonas monsensis]|uniref:hypothetical protein n=1 Tax=Pseudomonas monsensis TaxID=2745509 RepID=UPI00164499AE|nr:hypothetical protein [Pseudomonas monsensis]QXI01123.1 hypothetical protein HV782_003745 [Pseudomonas monsensis]
MYKIVTQEMLRAAFIRAIEINLIPRHRLLAEYLKSGEKLEQVIQAALEAQPKIAKFCGLRCTASEELSPESKKALAIPAADMRH